MDADTLRWNASQDTLISMHQIDPSPIESPVLIPAADDRQTPDNDLDDATTLNQSAYSSQSTSNSTSSLGLSGSGRGSIYYLSRIQRYSSYLIPVFTTIHLTTTSIIPLISRSVPASETYLLQARELYQTPLSEPLLVALPIAAHISSGLGIRLLRRARNLNRYYGVPSTTRKPAAGPRIWPPITDIAKSGYLFALALLAHAGVNRALPLLVEGHSSDVGLAFVGHGFARHGLLSWAAYAVLLGAGCGHMVWGAAKWAGLAPVGLGLRGAVGGGPEVKDDDKTARKRRRRTWWAVQGVAVGFAALWAAGGLGVVAGGGLVEGWVGKVYDGMYNALPF